MQPPSDRTRVRRKPARGHYDASTVEAILDEAAFCHVGFVHDGQPVVIPTIHARAGDVLYLHGSTASRMLRTLAAGTDVCVTATILDGLVLARSAFHHSMNYRSVVVMGRAEPVETDDEKMHALHAVSDHILPGRWEDARHPTTAELRQTALVRIDLSEASAKIRTGGPVDDEEDYSLPVWAGVLPVETRYGAPVPDEQLHPGIGLPRYLRDHRDRRARLRAVPSPEI